MNAPVPRQKRPKPITETITRPELVEIVETALPECAESTKEKYREIARSTQAIAVGWFHCGGVGCPARQAGRTNQSFQTAFDKAMGARFGREWDETYPQGIPFEPFVVRVKS